MKPEQRELRFKCDLCPYRSTRNCYIQRHVRQFHSDLRPFKCLHPGCTHSAKTKGNLGRHMETHQAERQRPYACALCEFRTVCQSVLNRHIQARHAPERTRDFECPLCPAKFFTEADARKHTQAHLNEKRFKCNHCDFRANNSGNLRTHVRAVHVKIQLECPAAECNFRTTSPASLKNHYRTVHHPDPTVSHPFPCKFPGCPYRGLCTRDVDGHFQRRHNPHRIKDLPCPFCAKKFYDEQHVRAHIKVHLNERPAKCSQCKFRAHNNCRLAKHVKAIHQKWKDSLMLFLATAFDRVHRVHRRVDKWLALTDFHYWSQNFIKISRKWTMWEGSLETPQLWIDKEIILLRCKV